MRRGWILPAILALVLVPSIATANGRATAVDLPSGERYYVYAHGGEFPTGHAIEIWQESNGLLACGIGEGVPVGHATGPGEKSSGLQVAATTCDGRSYAPDTRIA